MDATDWLLRLSRSARAACLAAVASFVLGCATWPLDEPAACDVKPQRERRARETARSFDHQRDQVQFQAAVSRWEQGDADGCREALARLLERNPDHLESRLMLCELCLINHDAQQAHKYLEEALAGHPNNPQVLHTMGLWLEATGKASQAAVYYERAVQLDPHNEVYRMSHEAVAGPAGSRTKAASCPTCGASAVECVSPEAADPDLASAQAQGLPSRGLLQRGGQALAAGAHETALAFFRRAAEASPNDPAVPISAAILALRYDEPELAVTILHPALVDLPESPGLYRVLGTAYYRLGDLRASRVALEQSLSLDNSSALSYFLMGSTLGKLGDRKAAQWHFRQARRLDRRFALDD